MRIEKRCGRFQKKYDNNWLLNDNFFGNGNMHESVKELANAEKLKLLSFSKNNDESIRECVGCRINGFTYKKDGFVLIINNIIENEEALGQIKNIFIIDEEILFELEVFHVQRILKNKRSILVSSANKLSFMFLNNIEHKLPIISKALDDETNSFLIQIRYLSFALYDI